MGLVQKRFYIYLEKFAANFSTRILSQNKDDLNIALKEKICDREKISYLGNGIDLNRFDRRKIELAGQDQKLEELGFNRDTPIIGFIGRLAMKRKGFADFLAAAKVIHYGQPQTQFLIVGEADQGRPDAAFPEIAKEYGIYENCRFVGWVPNDQIPMLVSLMNVLVLPSSLEGIPRSLMEASAMGVPIVATNVKGNRDVVVNRVNGILVPYANVSELSRSILELINNPGKARTYGQQGRKIAQEKFDEKIVFERVKHVYRDLLQERNLHFPGSF
jgi:glycosyltransferase involved in cell wall biosynthesis